MVRVLAHQVFFMGKRQILLCKKGKTKNVIYALSVLLWKKIAQDAAITFWCCNSDNWLASSFFPPLLQNELQKCKKESFDDPAAAIVVATSRKKVESKQLSILKTFKKTTKWKLQGLRDFLHISPKTSPFFLS